MLAEITGPGAMAAAVEADLTDPQTPAMLFDRAQDKLGPVDVLLIAEFARRHIDRAATWGRIVGLTSGGHLGFDLLPGFGRGGTDFRQRDHLALRLCFVWPSILHLTQ